MCFRKFDLYETVPEVRERMAELATKRLCKDVKAIYFFDMLGKFNQIYYISFWLNWTLSSLPPLINCIFSEYEFVDDEKFYVDWKNGSGSVGIGEPPMDKKPDVSFTLRKEWLIKVLNRKYR